MEVDTVYAEVSIAHIAPAIIHMKFLISHIEAMTAHTYDEKVCAQVATFHAEVLTAPIVPT